MIFYERSESSQKNINNGLIEIKDKEFLSKCKADYLLSYSQDSYTMDKVTTPLICGTIVKEEVRGGIKLDLEPGINNMSFIRKLRMIRADIFTLLGVCESSDFIHQEHHIYHIKKGCIKFLHGEFNERAKKLEIFDTLKGWNKIMHHKCYNNNILDMKVINEPKCVTEKNAKPEETANDCKNYAFAAFLKPGYHQVLIYDPHIHKAFCQEIIIDINHNQVLFPDLPFVLKHDDELQLPDVFRKWTRDNLARQTSAY